MILGIDPGPAECAFCLVDHDFNVVASGKASVDRLITVLRRSTPRVVAMEKIRGYGKRVGAETFETCRIEGRIIQVCEDLGVPVHSYCRKTYGQSLAQERTVNDSILRKALVDRFGAERMNCLKGNTDLRSAFAVAVYRRDVERYAGVG